MIADVLQAADEWRGKPMALATVIETWGSAPNPVGTHLLMKAGSFVGSVSSGCVENDVLFQCEEVLGGAPFMIKRYHSNQAGPYEPGLPCGGDIVVMIQPVSADGFDPSLFDLIRSNGAKRLDTLVSTNLQDGQSSAGPGAAEACFTNRYAPPVRLIIIGAVAIGQVLARLASISGFDVIVIDPRPFYGKQDRLPDVPIRGGEPAAVLSEIAPDRRTAIVTLSHDVALDDPALVAACNSDAGYIGALGSMKSHAARLERLSALGLNNDRPERIDGPAGVDIGGRGAEGIAISILAGIVQAMNG
jgi:xanthine dehydrogenase accessory factor